ncbi:hypothetical protein RSOL_180450, partial [Rhizoctonia solani AG-3 Rhs1AP]
MPRLNEIFIEVRSAQETLDAGQTSALLFLVPIDEHISPDMWCQPRRTNGRHSFGIHLDSKQQWMTFLGRVLRLNEYDHEFRLIGWGSETKNERCLNSFEQSMVIQVVYGAIVQQDTPQKTAPNSNLEDLPRYRRPHRTIFGWRKAKKEQEQEQEQQMTRATINDMQDYLMRLIYAHSVRVEQYQWLTKAIATVVASDIRRVTDEVWRSLNELF